MGSANNGGMENGGGKDGFTGPCWRDTSQMAGTVSMEGEV